jgi:uncharacterized membrane protein (DUF2068 family)
MLARGRGWIVAIAIDRIVKALVLLAGSIGALALIGRDRPELAERVVDWLEVDRGRVVVEWLLARVAGFSNGMLLGIGLGGFGYAVLALVEAYGLLRARAWAEWLTIGATGIFIPFEIYALVNEPTALELAIVALNVAIVVVLAWHRREARRRQVLSLEGA